MPKMKTTGSIAGELGHGDNNDLFQLTCERVVLLGKLYFIV